MTPDEKIAAVAARQYGVFTSAQAYRVGFTADTIRRRCESGRWIAVHRGVYAIAGIQQTWTQAVCAAVLASGSDAAASGGTAGALWEFIEQQPGPVRVTVPFRIRRKRRSGIDLSRAHLTRTDVRKVTGISLTAPNRTLVDIAGELRAEQLEAALDTALFKGLTSVQAVDRYIRERRLEHRPGVGRLRRMIADRAKGTSQSELERIFFRKLKKSRLPVPTRQFAVGRRLIDISYPDKRLIIELDGASSRFTAAQLRDDRRRQNEVVLALHGWSLLRFTWGDVVNNWPYVDRTLTPALRG